MGRILLVK